MLASENDALAGGKVGGIGDVIRDVPVALADQGCKVDVLTPAYQLFSKQPDAEKVSTFEISFAGINHQVQLYKIPPKKITNGVDHWAVELPQVYYGSSNGIYYNDSVGEPFATDATKFACFCVAAASAIVNGQFAQPDVIHLHDWHSALLLLLRDSDPVFSKLQSIRCVYTIHNLALQGVRPLSGHDSALHSWYPELDYQQKMIVDPVAQDCVNPMRIGINLADKVHVVSPTYAREILMPSVPERGFIGGEGLQQDLKQAKSQARLIGILNGCDYPRKNYKRLPKQKLVQLLDTEILRLITKQTYVDTAMYVAQKRISSWRDKKQCSLLLTSIGRITDQKVSIFKQKMPSGKAALEELLLALGDDGVFILLGNGDIKLEQFLTAVAGAHENFIFIKGYCENLSDALYQSGGLFVMPSSFEPCGISQMLAMRAGQPCLVHAVGGLKDTVKNDINGFSFQGDTPQQQAAALLQRFNQIKQLHQDSPEKYRIISDSARKARFSWKKSAQHYISRLYRI